MLIGLGPNVNVAREYLIFFPSRHSSADVRSSVVRSSGSLSLKSADAIDRRRRTRAVAPRRDEFRASERSIRIGPFANRDDREREREREREASSSRESPGTGTFRVRRGNGASVLPFLSERQPHSTGGRPFYFIGLKGVKYGWRGTPSLPPSHPSHTDGAESPRPAGPSAPLPPCRVWPALTDL